MTRDSSATFDHASYRLDHAKSRVIRGGLKSIPSLPTLMESPVTGRFGSFTDLSREDRQAESIRAAALAIATGPQAVATDGVVREGPAMSYLRSSGALAPNAGTIEAQVGPMVQPFVLATMVPGGQLALAAQGAYQTGQGYGQIQNGETASGAFNVLGGVLTAAGGAGSYAREAKAAVTWLGSGSSEFDGFSLGGLKFGAPIKMYAVPPGPSQQTVVVRSNTVTFTTDASGAPLSASGSLREAFSGAGRGSAELQAQRAVVAASGLPGDQAGHLVAHRFVLDNGPMNLFPQEGNFNMSAFKTLENDYARYVTQGNQVDFNHTLENFSASGRPGAVSVTYRVLDPAGSVVDAWSGRFSNQSRQTYVRRSR